MPGRPFCATPGLDSVGGPLNDLYWLTFYRPAWGLAILGQENESEGEESRRLATNPSKVKVKPVEAGCPIVDFRGHLSSRDKTWSWLTAASSTAAGADETRFVGH